MKNCEHCNKRIASSRKKCPNCKKDVSAKGKVSNESFPKGCLFFIIGIILIIFIYQLITDTVNWKVFTAERVGMRIFQFTAIYLILTKGLNIYELLDFNVSSKKPKKNKQRVFEKKSEKHSNQVHQSSVEKKYSKLLKLNGGESIKDIENSYKSLIKKYHPDKVASMGEEIIKTAEEKTKELNDAYDFFKKKLN